MLTVLDIFSGIGGFSLGLERAGMRTVAFCEIEPYCRAVLQKHWPEVPIWKDIRGLNANELKRAGIGNIDVICGGFPCQDIILAGKGAGLAGERSGLWLEYLRLIKETTPRYAIIENVSALRGRGLDEVLRSLFEVGYDAEWHCIPACAVGAPHQRDRIWIVANANSKQAQRLAIARSECDYWATEPDVGGKINGLSSGVDEDRALVNETHVILTNATTISDVWGPGWEENIPRVVNGVPARAHRIRALGNAVVPQIPEMIGRAVIKAENKK